jgi:acetolactate synthase-1/2/3 large subunit
VAFVNALSGLTNAFFDGAPMLLISGAGAHRTAGLGHFQDMDHVAVAAPLAKFARLIDRPERSAQILEQALDAASAWPPGPVHLTYPMDIQTAEVDPASAPRYVPAPALEPVGDVEQVAAALVRSERPLLVAGSGVFYAGEGEALMEFSERSGVPVVVPIWDRGSIERPLKTFCGVVGALSGGAGLPELADFLLLAGTACDYRLGFLQRQVPSAMLLRGWRSLGSQVASPAKWNAWLEEARRRVDEFRANLRQKAREQAQGRMHAVNVLDLLRPFLTRDTVFLIDAGSVGQWAHHLLCDHYPSRWLTCGRSGVVGWGIGGAMGARLAYPSNPVILLAGDGAFTFNATDLECAVRQRLPFVAIVADDQAWGITRAGHLRHYGQAMASELGPVRFAALADSLGATGVEATDPDALQTALRQALDADQVTVIHTTITGGNPS